MPLIPLDFTGVESYDNLPLGKYYGSIDKIELRPASEPGKFDQFMVTYMVTDEGELLGRKSSEFLSLSPKALFRLKKFFDHFGITEELDELDVDDDTNLLVKPDLIAADVIFEVYQDPKLYQGERQIRTRLVEVLEEAPAPAPAPRAAARPARAAAPAPEPEAAEDEVDEEEPPVAVAPARRPVAAAAAAPARRALR